MSNVKNAIKKEKKAAAPFSFEFNKVTFATQHEDSYRVKVSTTKDGVLFWIENKKSKSQWQAIIATVAECGPSDIPEDAVLAFLKNALVLIETGEHAAGDPIADLEPSDTEMVLTLTLTLGSIWKPQFTFVLLPVGLDKVNLLEAKLRDALEEIERLKITKFASFRSKSMCAHEQMFVWDGVVVPMVHEDGFKLSEDKRQVIVQVAGTYEVNIEIKGNHVSNEQRDGVTSLHLNGVDVSHGYQADMRRSYLVKISQLFELKAGDVLQVRCGFANGSCSDYSRLINYFNILRY